MGDNNWQIEAQDGGKVPQHSIWPPWLLSESWRILCMVSNDRVVHCVNWKYFDFDFEMANNKQKCLKPYMGFTWPDLHQETKKIYHQITLQGLFCGIVCFNNPQCEINVNWGLWRWRRRGFWIIEQRTALHVRPVISLNYLLSQDQDQNQDWQDQTQDQERD